MKHKGNWEKWGEGGKAGRRNVCVVKMERFEGEFSVFN
jgi:hypothetical protein